MWFYLFWTLNIIMLAVVFAIGDREEKAAAIVVTAAYIGTAIFYRVDGADWLQPQVKVLLIDLVAFAILLCLTLKSKRHWPLFITAWHFIPIIAFFATRAGGAITSYAAGLTQGLWSYLQIALLIVVAIRSKMRRQNKIPN